MVPFSIGKLDYIWLATHIRPIDLGDHSRTALWMHDACTFGQCFHLCSSLEERTLIRRSAPSCSLVLILRDPLNPPYARRNMPPSRMDLWWCRQELLHGIRYQVKR